MAMVGFEPELHFVETSPVLRAAQFKLNPDAQFHDDISTLPDHVPLIIVANEFFDALPIHQLVKHADQWHQRLVGCEGDAFAPVVGNPVPDEIIPVELQSAPHGSVIETSPACVGTMRDLASRIVRQGGAGILIDYGYKGPAVGDTLQAIRQHQHVKPFVNPGDQDLTAHVDFETLGAVCEMAGARVFGPVGQGQWLTRLGLVERTVALASVHPARAEQFNAERDRLASANGMGDLFRVLSICAPGWPEPDGF
jgi:NADH dehydrogenase [ubiquinone] 1 alpha subcomplex assembly factor 7